MCVNDKADEVFRGNSHVSAASGRFCGIAQFPFTFDRYTRLNMYKPQEWQKETKKLGAIGHMSLYFGVLRVRELV